jgi:3-oxoadipate enol-lactonase
MPTVTADDGCAIFYRWDGKPGRPVVLLANSLGTTLEMWDPQVAALSARYRVVRYDSRGHGRSGAPAGPYAIERLGRDAVALVDALELERVRFCGLSKGGMVGLWLGAHAGDRLERLVIANSSANVGNPEVWNQRIATVREQGMTAIVPGVIDRWFTVRFQNESLDAVERIARMLRDCPPDGYVACCAAVRDMNRRGALAGIRVPTLVIGGTHDLATPMDHARLIASTVPGAKLVELDAAHLSNVERASEFNRHLLGSLA